MMPRIISDYCPTQKDHSPETQQNQKEIVEDRNLFLQASIVRVMKARKEMALDDLTKVCKIIWSHWLYLSLSLSLPSSPSLPLPPHLPLFLSLPTSLSPSPSLPLFLPLSLSLSISMCVCDQEGGGGGGG